MILFPWGSHLMSNRSRNAAALNSVTKSSSSGGSRARANDRICWPMADQTTRRPKITGLLIARLPQSGDRDFPVRDPCVGFGPSLNPKHSAVLPVELVARVEFVEFEAALMHDLPIDASRLALFGLRCQIVVESREGNIQALDLARSFLPTAQDRVERRVGFCAGRRPAGERKHQRQKWGELGELHSEFGPGPMDVWEGSSGGLCIAAPGRANPGSAGRIVHAGSPHQACLRPAELRMTGRSWPMPLVRVET